MARCGFNDLGRFALHSSSWTTEGIKCYQRNCICEGCIYEFGFYTNSRFNKQHKQRCQMKASVLEMVRRFGVPPNIPKKEFLKEE